MSETYINRSLTTIHNELEFLLGEKVISKQFYDQLTEKLPTKYNRSLPPVSAITATNSETAEKHATSGPPAYDNTNVPVPVPSGTRPSSSSPHAAELAEALFDYRPTDPQDLELASGDKVEVSEKVNNDWWKGTNKSSGKSGLFPSNYVKLIGGGSDRGSQGLDNNAGPVSYGYAGQPSNAQGYYNGPPNQYGPPGGNQYGSPAPPQDYPYQQQPFPSYPLQNQGYQSAPPVAQPAAPAQQSQASGGLRRFGHKLGDAAIFGAGATIGSDIINSIF